MCCGCLKESSRRDGSFEHPKRMFKLMGKKIIAVFAKLFCLIGPLDFSHNMADTKLVQKGLST